MRTQMSAKDPESVQMRGMRCVTIVAIAAIVLAAAPEVRAGVTSVTGSGQSHSNMQPSLALNYTICLQGIFPSQGSGSVSSSAEPYLGEVNIFAGNFAPRGWALCQGQLLPINQNQSLYSILGTTYGGDGRTNFALPDLRGRTPIGVGQGAGLANRPLGQKSGVETVTLSAAQMPNHNHTLPPSSQTTGNTGGSQPHTNMQPYLTMTHTIAPTGPYPSPDGGGASGGIGSIDIFAGNFTPGDSEFTQGQLLPIAQNTALFSILGTTYGGDGRTTFGLPDLSGRAAVHAGTGPGLTPRSLGSKSGIENVALTEAQIPSHDHTLPPSSDTTGSTGGSQPHTNTQPNLAVNYMIALYGIYPGGAGGEIPYIGQVEMFAGNFAPRGWALCDGQLLSISDNDALFSILGTTYGGDGRTTFGLPDLRGRTAIGAGHGPGLSSYFLGQRIGTETLALSAYQLPAHSHSTPEIPAVPEPTSTALCLVGLAGLAIRRFRNRNHG